MARFRVRKQYRVPELLKFKLYDDSDQNGFEQLRMVLEIILRSDVYYFTELQTL